MKYRELILPFSIFAITLAFGLYFFLSQWNYSEAGHATLLMSYCAVAAGILIALRFSFIKTFVLLLVIVATIITYSGNKFEWRKNYIIASKAGDYFKLEPYIDAYPLYEDYLFSAFNDKPQFVAFNNECFKPSLSKKEVVNTCRSLSLIQDEYNVDVMRLIDNQYYKMKNTAKLIQEGGFTQKIELEQCILDGRCAPIPLLPAHAKNVSVNDNQYIEIRQQFWSLIEDETISPENCEFMDLCRGMRNINVIAITRPENSDL